MATAEVRGAAPLEVAAVHPPPPLRGLRTVAWRHDLRALPHATPDGALRVLAGDFNSTLDHAELRRLLDSGYVDAAAEVGAGLEFTWPHDRSWWPPPVAIDHVLADERAGVRAVSVHAISGPITGPWSPSWCCRDDGHAAAMTVVLRPVEPDDLPVFFANQADPGAAALVGLPSRDRAAFDAHWERILADPSGVIRTIVTADGAIAGNILSFLRDDEREVGYWLGRDFWGRGIATQALSAFLHIETRRPLHAGVAPHNTGSLRVLEKCGFTRLPQAEDDLILLHLTT